MYQLIFCSILLFYCTASATCCPKGFSGVEEAYQVNDLVVEGLIVKMLQWHEVFKVPAGLERTIVNSLVLVTYRCSKHLLVGDRLVFFGKVTQVNPFIMALDDCSPTGHLPECDMSNLRTKDFSNQCGEIAHSCRCEKNHGPGTVWQTGIFDCYTCSCSDDSTCTTSCSFHYTCAVIPTVGLGVILSILLLFGLLCCIWSKKRTSKDAELEEPLVPMEVNHVAINTQPVVMMSQTGEPLLVKVAYVQ